MQEPEIRKSTDEARAGSTPGIVRWVLLISLTLAVIAMGVVLVLSFVPGDRSGTVSAETRHE